jgi:inhibitor of KinA sporulation pathway (predicted exonuclease)
MKKLVRVLGHRRTLVFLDFEGTQQSHEMIAFAAIKAELRDDLSIKKTYKGIHHLVRPKKEVGRYVTKLTNITEIDVVDKGLPFAKALLRLRNYVGKNFQKSVFVVFGNHDVRILNQSLHYSPDGDTDIVKTITKNALDFSTFLSEFVKDDKGNPLSLINNLAVFKESFVGNHHHPLDDTKNLVLLYRLVLAKKDIILEEYLKVLMHLRHVPEPVKVIIQQLLKDEPVTKTSFMATIKEYIG